MKTDWETARVMRPSTCGGSQGLEAEEENAVGKAAADPGLSLTRALSSLGLWGLLAAAGALGGGP